MKTKDINYFEHQGWILLTKTPDGKYITFIEGTFGSGFIVYSSRREARRQANNFILCGRLKVASVSVLGDYK